MPQWIQILDYADSYASFFDYDAERSIALLLFKILYLELVHKSFPFMRFGRAIGKSELQKETSLKPLLLPDMALRVPCHAIWGLQMTRLPSVI